MIVRQLITLLSYQTDDKGARDYEARLQRIANIAKAVGAAAVAAGTLVALAGDAMTRALAQVESSLGRSATSAAAASDVYEKLYEMSLRTGVGANDSAEAFVRFNMAMRDLGRPAQDTIDLIEGLQASAIVAGVTTEDLTGTMRQLGQALASGKLNGDELVRLRESMPQFLRETSAAMGVTLAQFMEMAEKGQLVPARLIPAMLQAGQRARRELAQFPMTMDRSFRILRNATQRWLADFDKALGLSQALARWFGIIAARVDAWRAHIATFEAWVSRLGGMPQILRAAAGAVAVLTAAVVAYRAAAIAAGIAQALWILPWVALGAAIVALGVLLADFVTWVQGEDMDTLFGSWFGDFATFIAPFMAKWQELKDWISSALAAIGAEFQRFWDHGQIQATMALFAGIAEQIMRAWEPLSAFFQSMWDGIIRHFNTAWETIQPIVEWIRSAMAWMEDPLGRRAAAAGAAGAAAMAGAGEGTGPNPGSPQAPTEDQRRARARNGLRGGAALDALRNGGVNGVNPSSGIEDRMPGAPRVEATQNNEITFTQTIQATGVSPAEIAAAAATGVQNGGQQIGQSQEAFARALAGANPRTEGATQ